MPRTPHSTLFLAAVVAGSAASCGGETGAAAPPPPVAEAPAPPAAQPRRVLLFDLMDRAVWSAADGAHEDVAPPVTHVFDFDGLAPAAWWSGEARNGGRSVDYTDGLARAATIAPAGGRAGAALQLGPGWPDRSRVSFIVQVPPLAQVTVRGRVQLAGNPLAAEASSREVLRVVEHRGSVASPIASRRSRVRELRESRRLDPSGWDRFERRLLTESETGTLEVQLLHRSGDAADAVTRFDDLEVEVEPLSTRALYERLRAGHRPRDGRAEQTPWRLRVELPPIGRNGRDVVRDALLLPPPGNVAFPLELPPVDAAPRLRFHYAMAPEAFGVAGDGARIEVRFEQDGAPPVLLHALEFDPKNERDQRGWQEARVDLAAVAGKAGRLVFATSDIPGSAPDDLDAVLISGPRIEPADEAPGAPNVLLIGVDTLRADRMSFFGYGRDTTPNLTRVADAGVRFPNTRSQAPWTLPSFASILTSLYPSSHGAGRGGHDEWTGIDPTTTALPEILARFGYETVGIVANGLIAPQYGIDQGFDSYASRWGFETAGVDALDVAAFIDAHRSTPWLMFWHILDPHLPYSTSKETREAFCDASYAGQFQGGRSGPQVPFGALDPRPGRRWFAHEGPPPAPDITDADRAFISDYYDAEVSEMDAAVGVVLDALEASGQWERTVIAFVADHGEGLGDHDHYHHGYTLFEDQVHVPMLLRVPGHREGETIARPVAAIDLAPTLLGALGLTPPDFFQGVDRLAAAAPSGDAYFVEYPTYDSSAQKAWVEGRFKYLHDPLFRTEALYDLQADPGERTNVAAEHPDVVARARAELDAFRWEELQKGRYHVRVAGAPGQTLRIAVATDDLFDANFVCRPAPPEEDLRMDLERQHLVLETTLEKERLELLFWGRAGRIDITATLDGAPLVLALGEDDERRALPAALDPGAIPVAAREDVPWPDRGVVRLWLEEGASTVLPVLPTPEEIEALQAMGYAH
jgi:arylsulfatase A-like enzyme